MRRIAAVLLIIAGIIHLLPLSGAFGVSQLARLYGITLEDPNLTIAMRHRAVLLGLLGLLLIAAAFRPQLRSVAYVVGLTSATSFLILAWSIGGYNVPMARVVMADIVATACLLAAIRDRLEASTVIEPFDCVDPTRRLQFADVRSHTRGRPDGWVRTG